VARLIDSSVIIEIERRGTIEADFAVVAAGEPMAISAITSAEVLAGAAILRATPKSRQIAVSVEAILQHFEILPFDTQSAQVYADLFVHLRSTGLAVGSFDLLIAATAIANERSVVTLNLREFRRIPGLTVIAPDW
jgi:predicted nucleic acid-binding protein